MIFSLKIIVVTEVEQEVIIVVSEVEREVIEKIVTSCSTQGPQ